MFDFFYNRYNPEPKVILSDGAMKHKYLMKDSFINYIYFIDSLYMHIPADHNEFKQTHKSKFWYNIRRAEKKLKKDFSSVYIDILTNPKKIEQYIDDVQKLFSSRWKDEYSSFSWKTKEGFSPYKEAMLELAKTDEACLAVIKIDNKMKLFGYILMNNEYMYLYQLALTPEEEFKRYDLASILMKRIIEFGIDNGKKELILGGDTGQGTGYKLKWAKLRKKMYVKIITQKTLLGFVKHCFYYIFLFIKFYIQRNRKLTKIFKRIMMLKIRTVRDATKTT